MLSNLTRIVRQLSKRNLRKLFRWHLRPQGLFDLSDVLALRNINRPTTISHWLEFWIWSGLCKLRVRALQHMPTLLDISLHRLKLFRRGLVRRISGECQHRQGQQNNWRDQEKVFRLESL